MKKDKNWKEIVFSEEGFSICLPECIVKNKIIGSHPNDIRYYLQFDKGIFQIYINDLKSPRAEEDFLRMYSRPDDSNTWLVTASQHDGQKAFKRVSIVGDTVAVLFGITKNGKSYSIHYYEEGLRKPEFVKVTVDAIIESFHFL